jgi:quercetin dioxygenase-like cupin family protein
LDQEDLVSYIALEGKGTFNLEGEDPYETRESIFIEKNAVHSLRADENAAFILSLCEGE